MPVINNENNLKKFIQSRLSLALKFTQQEVYKVIQENIKNYYEEKVFINHRTQEPSAIPDVYNRTYQFLNSLIKTDVIIKNGQASCSVMIDTESLNYVQDGKVVIDMINRGFHADTSLNNGVYQTPGDISAYSHFWDDSLRQLGGYNGILAIMKRNCQKAGIPVE